MLRKIIGQAGIRFQPGTLPATTKYYQKYERISEILDQNPQILDLVHADISKALDSFNRNGRRSKISTENVLRACIVQTIEKEPLRKLIIRIDESDNLRHFVRIYNGDMFSFSTFCSLRNHIKPNSWEKINRLLAVFAIEQEYIDGERLRIDTTAVETDIHYPTDSSLLADTYRVMARLVKVARKIHPELVGTRRLREAKVKKLQADIARSSRKKGRVSRRARKLYSGLFHLVETILELGSEIRKRLAAGSFAGSDGSPVVVSSPSLVLSIDHFLELGHRVLDQARRRIVNEENVPAEEKLYSIFEDHTELIKRGKAGKPIEFGHMILLEQVGGKFISGYTVFDKKPNDNELVDSTLERHEELFGYLPTELSADKGFYESMDKVEQLEDKIDTVSICKKGSRTDEEKEREGSPSC